MGPDVKAAQLGVKELQAGQTGDVLGWGPTSTQVSKCAPYERNSSVVKQLSLVSVTFQYNF